MQDTPETQATQAAILAELDALDRMPTRDLGEDPHADARMEAFVAAGGQRRTLVERYAGSLNRRLAYGAVTHLGPQGSGRAALAAVALGRLRLRYDGPILAALLEALAGGSWLPGWQAPTAFFPLLRDCLTYGYTQPATTMLMTALNNAARPGQGGNLRSFSPLALAWLRTKLQRLTPLRVDYDWATPHLEGARAAVEACGPFPPVAALARLDALAQSPSASTAEAGLVDFVADLIDGCQFEPRTWVINRGLMAVRQQLQSPGLVDPTGRFPPLLMSSLRSKDVFVHTPALELVVSAYERGTLDRILSPAHFGELRRIVARALRRRSTLIVSGQAIGVLERLL